MFEELSNSIKAILYERVSSPLGGVFILSWLIFNWEVIALLFLGEGNIYEKITYVNDNFLTDPNVYIWYPLYTTILILLIYPVISILPFYWWQFWDSLRIKVKQKIEGQTLLTVEQSNKLRQELLKSQIENYRLIEEKDKEIEILKNQLNDDVSHNLDNPSNKKIAEQYENIDTNDHIYENKSVEEVIVNNSIELIKAISPGKKIVLKSSDYNLDSVDTSYENNYISFKKNIFDGYEIIINGVSDLHIVGGNSYQSRIVVSPQYSNVFVLNNCMRVTFENIEMGHVPKGHCTGGVLKLAKSYDITIKNCDLFGCGTEGLTLDNCNGLFFTKSKIIECVYGIMTVENSSNLIFSDSEFKKNREFDLVNVINCKNFVFENCEFTGNETVMDSSSQYSMFSVKGNEIIIKDSKINRNKANYLMKNEETVNIQNTNTDNNEFTALFDEGPKC